MNKPPTCSPRMRGWSLLDPPAAVGVALLPAHAGLVPGVGRPHTPASPAPRACGVGPYPSTDQQL
ncbi:hypothetical protein KPATCC21470_1969 [Kitasatospora purpeofusca]